MRNSGQPSLFGSAQDEEKPFDEPTVKTHNKAVRADHKILALDLATITGYCDAHGSGSWNFTTLVKKPKDPPKRLGKQTNGKKLVRFETRISAYIEEYKPKMIVIEKAFIYQSKERKPNFTAFEMAGILKLLCEANGIFLVEYHVQHIKKFGTGNGMANKEMMMDCCARYRVKPVDSNEADALHLYHLAISDFIL